MGEEIGRFKAIARHIARREVGKEQAGWFEMEKRQYLRRLAGLGIQGHQPAIAGHVKITEEEKEKVIKAIMQQKVGHSPSISKAYDDLRQASRGG